MQDTTFALTQIKGCKLFMMCTVKQIGHTSYPFSQIESSLILSDLHFQFWVNSIPPSKPSYIYGFTQKEYPIPIPTPSPPMEENETHSIIGHALSNMTIASVEAPNNTLTIQMLIVD